jgi:hypothetical protein
MRLNRKKLIFSGVITGFVGMGLGLILSRMFPSPYHGWNFYTDLWREYMIAGAIGGFLLGLSQETIRQLKKERDRQDPD